MEYSFNQCEENVGALTEELNGSQWCLSRAINKKPSLMFSPVAGARIEEFLYEKLDRKAPSRITNAELLGQYMQDAGKEFDLGAPYGEYAIN